MKNLFITATILVIFNTQASGEIKLIQECSPTQSACDLLSDYDSGKKAAFHGSISKRLVISKGDVETASISKGSVGSTISIKLKDYLSAQLKSLTRESVNKRLLIVVDDEVLSAPVVREEITGGTVMISLPKEDTNLSEKLKWLKELSSVTSSLEKQEKRSILNSGIAWSTFLFLGTLTYSFVPRKSKA